MNLTDLFVDRAQYRPSESVRLLASRKTTDTAETISAVLRLWSLNKLVLERKVTFCFENGESICLPVELGRFEGPIAAFGVEAECGSHTLYTAFDVTENESQMPRYGFLCRFDDGASAENAVQSLLQNHITWAQFYDWMYRHEQLLPAEEQFTDLMGRNMDIRHAKKRITLCLEKGIKPIAYGAVYAASYPFAERHRDWMLYGCGEKPLDFIGLLRYMNISEGTPWREHIKQQFTAAVEQMGFAGIHMDTYGYPKQALAADGQPVRLERCFPSLINETRIAIREKTQREPLLVFNNVGNWPVDTVAHADQNAIYIEAWPPYDRYAHLRDIALQVHLMNTHKPLILAAYAKAFMNSAKQEAWHSAFLLQGILAACGAHALLLGEDGGMLMQAYYVDYHTEKEEEWLTRQRRYSDFVVRWETILFSDPRRDVTKTHAFGDNREYCFSGTPVSLDLAGGNVGVVINEIPQKKVIHLFDLRETDDLWQQGKQPAQNEYALTVDVMLLRAPQHVYTASPEVAGGGAVPLPYTLVETDTDLFVHIEVCGNQPWQMIVIDE